MHVTPGGARISRTAAVDLQAAAAMARRGRARDFRLRAIESPSLQSTPKPAQIFDTDVLLEGHHDWVGSGHPQMMQGFGKKCRGLVTVETYN